ncbi:MAG: hypothetical protein A2Z51_06780 [Deltaproteobacteria bacterium RBG_19FT_COMBO_52_11]|nr:MAG: hypothetical protein A2Z51_06780 [Deltaproteobacteria bacterium RBG_19FT_COMBO_52_11]
MILILDKIIGNVLNKSKMSEIWTIREKPLSPIPLYPPFTKPVKKLGEGERRGFTHVQGTEKLISAGS